MYDNTMPIQERDSALQAFAVHRAQTLLRRMTPEFIEKVGGEERFMKVCWKQALAARDALTIPPRVRLKRTITFWSKMLKALAGGNPPPAEMSEDDLFSVELDSLLQARILEIERAFEKDDVAEAFRLFKNITTKREGEEHELNFTLPDSLDPTSPYWLDVLPAPDN